MVQQQQHQHRIILLIFSFCTIAFAAGLIYGWPSLRRNLVTNEGSLLTENQFGIIFTVGSWSTQGSRFFLGIARDRFLGTSVTTCICLVATAVGCSIIAFCGENNVAAFIAAFFLVGLGSGAQLCLMPVASLFPTEYQGSIMASFAGAFQLAGMVFFVLIAISVDRKESFGSFALCLGLLALMAYLLLPRSNFTNTQKEEGDIEDMDAENVGDDEQGSPTYHINGTERDQNEEEHQIVTNHLSHDEEVDQDKVVSISSETNDMSSKATKSLSVVDQIRSVEYILLVLWFSILNIPVQYYVAVIGFQLERMGDDDGKYTRLFSMQFALAAAFAPILGKIADRLGLGPAQAVATLLASTSVFFLTLKSISLNMHIVGMSCFGLGRVMLFGMFFANVGKRFGYDNYGTLAGLGLFISACSSLLQYPLISLAAAGSDETVNLVSALIMLGLGLPYSFWLWRRENTSH